MPDTGGNRDGILADYDGDGASELLVANYNADAGIEIFELLADTPSWMVAHPPGHLVPIGSIGLFGIGIDRVGFIRPSTAGHIQAFDTQGAGSWAEPLYHRDGQVTPVEPERVAELSAVTVADIDGDGIEEALVGTGDGYLMALKVTDGSLAWSMNLRYAVGEPIVADVDGDGELEVLVSAMDGYLRMIDQAGLPTPEDVRDVALDENGELLAPETDADVTERRVGLGAAWDAVPGADGYVVSALFDGDVNIVPWQDVGNVTEAVIHDALLVLGKSYQVVVQAYSEDGKASQEGISDGAELQDLTPPEVVQLAVSPSAFNAGLETTEIRAELKDITGVTAYAIDVLDTDHRVIRSFSGKDSDTRVTALHQWDGRNSLGARVTDGEYSVVVTVEDFGEHTASASASVTVDGLAPLPPVILAPAEGALIADPQPLVQGAAEPSTKVDAYIDGIATCSAVSSQDGSWACRSSLFLGEGWHQAAAEAEDQASNRSARSPGVSFFVDGEAPGAPTITEPQDGSALNTLQPRFSGTATADAVQVEVLDRDGVLCQGEASQGQWQCQPEQDRSEGELELWAEAVDESGNRSAPSTRITVVLDVTPPVAPAIESPAGSAVIAAQRVQVSGVSEPGTAVQVRVDEQDTLGCMAQAGPLTGEWQCITRSDLGEGWHDVVARATDRAGNLSEPSDAVSFVIDLSSPPAPVLTTPADQSQINQVRPVFEGMSVHGLLVEVRADGYTVCAGAPVSPAGYWVCESELRLAQGEHVADAIARTTSGVASAPSAEMSFSIDTESPPAPQITWPTMDRAIGEEKPAFAGESEPGTLVRVRLEDRDIPLCEADANESGRFSCTSRRELRDDYYWVVADAFDPAGNVSEPSEPVGFVIIAGKLRGGGGCLCSGAGSGGTGWWSGVVVMVAIGLRRRKQ